MFDIRRILHLVLCLSFYGVSTTALRASDASEVLPHSAVLSQGFASSIDFKIHTNQTGQTVFSAKGKASSAEDIYFGMLQVDQGNLRAWSHWSQASARTAAIMKSLCFSDSYNEESKWCTAEQFLCLKEKFAKNGVTSSLDSNGYDTYSTKLKAITTIPEAQCGFTIGKFVNGVFTVNESTYVAYVSKKPFQSGPDLPDFEVETMEDFITFYDSLLMTVSCHDNPDTPSYYNRGIFRNPLSFLESGYKGISLQLHSFTALVMQTINSDKMFMVVSPMTGMRKQLDKHLVHGEDYLNERDPGYNNYFCDRAYGEKPMQVKISSLVKKLSPSPFHNP